MPNIYIIAGSNGAGKTTLANVLLPEFLKCNEFVNADSIAAGLSPFNPAGVAMQAGRLMLERINNLAADGKDFAFETTLSTRSYAGHIKKWVTDGYDVHLIFLWLNSVDISIKRVEKRVKMGGHFIPENVIRRRYERGIYNFYNLYKDLVTSWEVYNNSSLGDLSIVAEKNNSKIKIIEEDLWKKLQFHH